MTVNAEVTSLKLNFNLSLTKSQFYVQCVTHLQLIFNLVLYHVTLRLPTLYGRRLHFFRPIKVEAGPARVVEEELATGVVSLITGYCSVQTEIGLGMVNSG